MTLPEVGTRGKLLGVLGAVCLAFVIGRGTQKTVTVEKVREVERVAEQKVSAAKAEVATAKTAAASDKVQWRTKTVYLPGGTVEVVKEVVREVERKQEERTAQIITRVETLERVVYRDRLKVTQAPLPRWSAGAHVGVGLDLHARYGGEVGRRLVEGLWLTAGIDVPTRAATLGIRVEF